MSYHVPVLAQEVLDFLRPEAGSRILDATLGGGGHSLLLAARVGVDGAIVGIDSDSTAIAEASRRLGAVPEDVRPRLTFLHGRYDRMIALLAEQGAEAFDGILFDLGVSSHQLDTPERGFTFKDPSSPLDMRMDQESVELTAADLLNELPEGEIARVLREYSDERWASRIAKFIVERRNGASYRTAGQLIDTVLAAIPAAARPRGIHPATRTFQALRIAVNQEFEALGGALRGAIDLLRPGGRIAVISYHSGEDRIVKSTFSVLAGKCSCPPNQPLCTCGALDPVLTLATRRPLEPQSSEIAVNPRARSAKMRVAERRKPHERAA